MEIWVINVASNYIRKARKTHLLTGETEINTKEFRNEISLIFYFISKNFEVDKN